MEAFRKTGVEAMINRSALLSFAQISLLSHQPPPSQLSSALLFYYLFLSRNGSVQLGSGSLGELRSSACFPPAAKRVGCIRKDES